MNFLASCTWTLVPPQISNPRPDRGCRCQCHCCRGSTGRGGRRWRRCSSRSIRRRAPSMSGETIWGRDLWVEIQLGMIILSMVKTTETLWELQKVKRSQNTEMQVFTSTYQEIPWRASFPLPCPKWSQEGSCWDLSKFWQPRPEEEIPGF